MKGLFVTGTDTEIGKTVVSAALIHALISRGLRVAGMKPVASGGRETPTGLRNEDAEALIAASNVTVDYTAVNPYCFAPPIAPHIAAREAGCEIRFAPIFVAANKLAAQADVLVVEGVGGWRVPLGPDGDLAALACAFDLPVVLVIGLRLGCLNQALLSAESIRASGCTLAGWVANRPTAASMERERENLATLETALDVPCLGDVPHWQGEAPTPTQVAACLDLKGAKLEF